MRKARNRLKVCFFGTGGTVLRLDQVLDAAAILHSREVPVDWVFCGIDAPAHAAVALPNVFFPGFVSRSEIRALMDICDIGIIPYADRADFRMSIPNKVTEYLSGGLPVLSSIHGDLGLLLTKNGVGKTYSNAEELVAVVALLCGSPSLLQQMSTNARAFFRRRFDADVVYRKYADLLVRLSTK